eukprot:jgi/Phyca11/101309/e_gw1.5.1396.1
MLPLYEGKLARVKGTAIAEFLKGKGFTLGPTAISRVKQAIEATHEMGRAPGSQLVPTLSAERKKLAISGEQCKVTPCMEGAYNVLFVGSSKQPGWVRPWRMVNLPDFECTCGNWQDNEFPCTHAIPAAVTEGQRIETLYDSKRLSIDHFRDTYMIPFRPWPTDVTLQEDTSLKVPVRQSDSPEWGNAGLNQVQDPSTSAESQNMEISEGLEV